MAVAGAAPADSSAPDGELTVSVSSENMTKNLSTIKHSCAIYSSIHNLYTKIVAFHDIHVSRYLTLNRVTDISTQRLTTFEILTILKYKKTY